jgi:hypothetical protein
VRQRDLEFVPDILFLVILERLTPQTGISHLGASHIQDTLDRVFSASGRNDLTGFHAEIVKRFITIFDVRMKSR